jgi:hypothetical protein
MRTSARILVCLALLAATPFVDTKASESLPGGFVGTQTEDPSDYPPRPVANCEETIKPPAPRCADFDCDDPLFRQYPPKGTWVTAHCSELTFPFAIYDSQSMGMFGSADLDVLRSITAGSGYHPVATESGRGIAGLFTSYHRDSNAVPYFETTLVFSVNERPGTVATDNPYAFVSELFRPRNKLWVVKLLLSHHMPIEYGREMLGYDKNPSPQNMVVTTDMQLSSVTQSFSIKDPAFNPIMSGRVVVDRAPAARAEALRLLASAPSGGDVLAKTLTEGGLFRVNLVSPDVLGRTAGLIKSYAVIRPKSVDLGLWNDASTLVVNPTSEYGATVNRMGFRPVVSAYISLREVIDNGHLP